MDDIFPTKNTPTPKRKRKLVAPTPSWRKQLPWGVTKRNKYAPDTQRTEDMVAGLTGLPADAGREHDLFVSTFTNALEDGVLALRVFELQGIAPKRMEGELRLSTRAKQRVRNAIRKGETRGTKLQFGATVFLEPNAEPLQDGVLVLRAGFDLALVPDGTHRASLDQWPEIEVSKLSDATERGCPLVVNDCDARSSWRHLSETGALAVYGSDSSLLWVFKVVPGEHFPSPFTLTELRRRAAGL